MLVDPAFGPDGLSAASAVEDEWFANESSLASFVCRSVPRDMMTRGMDDQQAPADEWDRFRADALPADPTTHLRDLVIGYHSSI